LIKKIKASNADEIKVNLHTAASDAKIQMHKYKTENQISSVHFKI